MTKEKIEKKVVISRGEHELAGLKEITTAPDFFAWKTKICKALQEKGETEYSDILMKEKSLLNFYMQKENILEKLGVD